MRPVAARATFLFGCMVGWLAALPACASMSREARDMFVHKYYCPAGEVRVTTRSDIAPHTVLLLQGGFQSPPPDVSRDPARLRVWEDDKRRHDREVDRDFAVYDVDGCGRSQQYLCNIGDDSTAACGPNVTARGLVELRLAPDGGAQITPVTSPIGGGGASIVAPPIAAPPASSSGN